MSDNPDPLPQPTTVSPARYPCSWAPCGSSGPRPEKSTIIIRVRRLVSISSPAAAERHQVGFPGSLFSAIEPAHHRLLSVSHRNTPILHPIPRASLSRRFPSPRSIDDSPPLPFPILSLARSLSLSLSLSARLLPALLNTCQVPRRRGWQLPPSFLLHRLCACNSSSADSVLRGPPC